MREKKRKIDFSIIGNRFGSLVVKALTTYENITWARWECLRCGSVGISRRNSIVMGHKSGCWNCIATELQKKMDAAGVQWWPAAKPKPKSKKKESKGVDPRGEL